MPKRILLIEDDKDFLELVTVMIRHKGGDYTLLVARDGQEGLQKAQTEQPDLIITDLMLPKMNGYEICAMLKQDVRFQKIPVVIWSATRLQDRDAKLAGECGADRFELKSLTSDQLHTLIQELTGRGG